MSRPMSRPRIAVLLAGALALLVIGAACGTLNTAPPPVSGALAASAATDAAPEPPPAPAERGPVGAPTSGAAPREPADCRRSLQQLVDEAAPGSTVAVPNCVYRETVTVNRPLTLIAEPGAEIRGSDVWTDWSQRDGLWVRAGLPPLDGAGTCLPDRDCQPPHQVFLDGKPLQRAVGRPAPGQFAVRGAEIRLADNPAGRVVEVSTRARWITGGADDVRIERFTMRHAVNSAQNGALNNDGYARWTIAQNTLTDAHGPLISIHGGTGHALLDNVISRSGQLGVHGTDAADVLVQGNQIRDNNLAGFDPEWEAGGLKMTTMTRLTVANNEVSNNDGWGLWCDIDCRDTTITANRVHHNSRIGISYEISRRGAITKNVVWENGHGVTGWGRGAGIICQNCTATTIADNLVAWCPDGIAVTEQDREIIGRVELVIVRSNTVVSADGAMALGWLTDRSQAYLFRRESRNEGADNRYWFAADEGRTDRFAWDGERRRLEAFNRTPGEGGGGDQ
jgi:hypothetical protein